MSGARPSAFEPEARMTDSDLRALYRFIPSLGPTGERAPAAVAPGGAH